LHKKFCLSAPKKPTSSFPHAIRALIDAIYESFRHPLPIKARLQLKGHLLERTLLVSMLQ
jgi:hypothetical protein